MIYIKSNREIEKIRAACRVVADVLALLKKHTTPGTSTAALNSIASDYILSRNGRPAFLNYKMGSLPDYPKAICVSVNSCIVHGIASSRLILREGDIVSIDVGVELDNYFGDAAVTYPVGKISEANERLLSVTSEALHLGIAQAKVGNHIGDISACIEDFVKKQGYFVADQLTGHATGKFLHEEPQIPNIGEYGTGHLIKKNMTLAIEPMVNIGTSAVVAKGWEFFTANGENSAHFEHTVLVTDSLPEILTI